MHHLKTWPEYFREIENGNKTFELRVNDRNFELGDALILEEYDPICEVMTGRKMMKIITYVLRDSKKTERMGLKPGYCIMGFKNKPEAEK